MMRFLIFLTFLFTPAAGAHEFDEENVDVMDAHAEVLDGDTTTLFAQMTITNGAPTVKVVGFHTDRGKIGDWVEVRRFFGRERVKVLSSKTLRTGSAYQMHRPSGYLVIHNVDPIVYTCNFGYILVQVLFEDGEALDVAVWIDPLYTQICN